MPSELGFTMYSLFLRDVPPLLPVIKDCAIIDELLLRSFPLPPPPDALIALIAGVDNCLGVVDPDDDDDAIGTSSPVTCCADLSLSITALNDPFLFLLA